MAVQKNINASDVFYKFIIESPEVIEKEDGMYLNPIFFLAYLNILSIYRILEPEHPLLKPLNDGKRYYSDTMKDQSRIGREDDELRELLPRIDDQNFNLIYETVEVENTLLLHYLMEQYGKKYLAQKYSLISRRIRTRELTVVPIELKRLFQTLGLGVSSYKSSYNSTFDSFTRDLREPFVKKHQTGRYYGLFQSVTSVNYSFSLAQTIAPLMTEFVYYSKESVQRVRSVPEGTLQITNVDSNPRPPEQFGRDVYDSLQKAPKLNQLLAYIQEKKAYFIEKYENILIKKEITDFMNSKMTNEIKEDLTSFFLSEKDFLLPIRFCGNRYGSMYHYRRTFEGIKSEMQIGFYGQLSAIFKMNPDLKSGNAISQFTLSTYGSNRSAAIIYAQEEKMPSPRNLLPLIEQYEQKETEQLSLLEEEGSPA